MKSIFKSFFSFMLFTSCLMIVGSCSDDDDQNTDGEGIQDISLTEKTVSLYGETVDVSFTAAAKWDAELVLSTGTGWARISSISGNNAAGKGTIKVAVDKNETKQDRTVTVNVTVNGYKAATICTLSQKVGDVSITDVALNKYMHEFLKEKYLFKDEYNTMTVDCEHTLYTDFLETNLAKMTTNIEDGGIYRAYSPYAGERYIYSYIEYLGKTVTRGNTRAVSQTVGTGLGTFFASTMADNSTIGLAVGYVYEDSPAAKAGLRRGDVITALNGERLTRNNYQAAQETLFYSTSGEFKIGYSRYIANEEMQQYELIDGSTTITAGAYYANPLLYSVIITDKNNPPTYSVGYMVFQSFDDGYMDELKYMIQQFQEAGITDFILDLRHNRGGSVEMSRYLSSSIAGAAHSQDIFMNLERSYTANKEELRFGEGDDLHINSLRVICSEETASASELVISSLRGIDFPVKIFGSLTAGKNVGMEVQNYQYGGGLYEFAPITFRSTNAKGWGDYADGIPADVMLNNQDSNFNNDIDNLFPYAFGDWENVDFNRPLWYALCDIRGIDPTTGEPLTRVGTTRALGKTPQMGNIERLPSAPLKQPIGKFGSLIYQKEDAAK
ncbi:S41 family peptidase [Bacteroides sp.]